MSTSSLRLLPLPTTLSPSELTLRASEFAAIHYTAFRPGQIFRSLFPTVKQYDFVAIGTRRFSKAMEASEKRGLKFVMAVQGEGEGEKVVGVAFWTLPKKKGVKEGVVSVTGENEEEKPKEKREFAEGTNVPLAEEFFEMLDKHDSNEANEPHYALQVLATDPSAQRSGAGSALLKWGMEKATEEGVDVRLDSTLEGVDFYPKYGFKKIGEPLRASDGSFELYPMIWTPSTKAVS